MTFLKQSTAVDIGLGPFVDSTDGVTAETGLTIAQADVRLKKNAGSWAQKSQASSATHEENGWYEVNLDTTDTGTLGVLLVAAAVSGALPVWQVFMVVPANVYDSLVGGSDTLQADVTQWTGTNVASPDTAGYPKVTVKSGSGTGEADLSSGRIKADVSHWNAAAIATPDTAGYPKVTVKSGTGTGELNVASGVVDADVEQWAGAAIATPDTAGYPKVTVKDGTGTGEIDLIAGVVAASISTPVDANVTEWSGAAVAVPDTAGYPKVTVKDGTGTGELDLTAGVVAASVAGAVTVTGTVDANVTEWSGSAVAATDTAGYPKVTVKDGTGAGELNLTAGAVDSNVTTWKGSDADTALKGLVGFLESGQAQAGAAGTITLDSSASGTDDAYTGAVIKIVAGTGVGDQPRRITDYVGATKVATVTPNFATTPDATTTYIIIGPAS